MFVFGVDVINRGMNATFVISPAVPGASYSWDDGRFAEIISSNDQPDVTYHVPWNSGTGTDYIGCTVTINGVHHYVHKTVTIR